MTDNNMAIVFGIIESEEILSEEQLTALSGQFGGRPVAEIAAMTPGVFAQEILDKLPGFKKAGSVARQVLDFMAAMGYMPAQASQPAPAPAAPDSALTLMADALNRLAPTPAKKLPGEMSLDELFAAVTAENYKEFLPYILADTIVQVAQTKTPAWAVALGAERQYSSQETFNYVTCLAQPGVRAQRKADGEKLYMSLKAALHVIDPAKLRLYPFDEMEIADLDEHGNDWTTVPEQLHAAVLWMKRTGHTSFKTKTPIEITECVFGEESAWPSWFRLAVDDYQRALDRGMPPVSIYAPTSPAPAQPVGEFELLRQTPMPFPGKQSAILSTGGSEPQQSGYVQEDLTRPEQVAKERLWKLVEGGRQNRYVQGQFIQLDRHNDGRLIALAGAEVLFGGNGMIFHPAVASVTAPVGVRTFVKSYSELLTMYNDWAHQYNSGLMNWQTDLPLA